MPRTTNFGRKARKTKQRKVKRYQKLREDLQLDGTIPTTAEGAVKSKERVDPSTQGEQGFPALIGQAMTEIHAIHEASDAQVDAVRAKTRDAMRAFLTPEQKPKFEEYVQRLDAERKKQKEAQLPH